MFKLRNNRNPLLEEEDVVNPPTPEEDVPLDPPLEEDLDLSTPPDEEPSLPLATPKEDIDAVRELILALHPAIVPKLISGDSVAALIASIAPAQETYAQIVSKVHIPAGGNPPITFDVDSLTTFDKIRRGLSAQSQRKG